MATAKSRDKKSQLFNSAADRNHTDLNSKGFSIKHVRIETVIALSLKYDTKKVLCLNLFWKQLLQNERY